MFNVTSGVYENTRFSGQLKVNPTSVDARAKQDFQAVLRQAGNTEKGSEEGDTRSPALQQRPQPETLRPIPLVRELEAASAASRAQLAAGTVQAADVGTSIAASQALLPDWGAAALGQTAGGIGDIGAWGEPNNWGSPERQVLEVGQTFVTPAGTYQAMTNPDGNFVLQPVDDALRPARNYLHSMTIGQHHIGIHPKTGEAWYQQMQTEALSPIPLEREYEAVPTGSRAQLANWWVHAAYCGPNMPASQALLPDWDAAAGGQTAGGVGNTDGWGKPINWGSPERQVLETGQTFVTPAGTYQAVTNPHGDLVLRPLDDALRPPGDYLHSMTIDQHHIGIHPKTGEVWYQQVA